MSAANTTPFLKSGNPLVLFAAFLYFDASFMVWVLLGALGNFIASDLGLSGWEKGLLTALPVLSGALLRPIVGALADRFGGRRAGIAGLVITLMPLAGGWLFASSLPTLLIVGTMLGVAGASFAVAMPLASRWYPAEHQGLALGLAGAGNGGTVLAAVFAPRLAEAYGWETVFGLMMLPIIVALGVFVLLAHDSPTSFKPRKISDVALIVKQPDAARFCLFYAVTFGGYVGLSSYLAIFLHEQYGLDRISAGDLTGVLVLAGSLARPVGGLAADRLGGARVLVIAYAAIAGAMTVMSHVPPLGVTVVILGTAITAMGLGNGAVFQLIPQRFPDQMGAMAGIVGAFGGVGGFFVPFAIGAMQDATGSYGSGFLLLAVPAGVCALILAGMVGRGATVRAPVLSQGMPNLAIEEGAS